MIDTIIWVKKLKRVARSDGLTSPCAMTSIIFHLLRVPAAGTAGEQEEGGDDDDKVILAAAYLISSSSKPQHRRGLQFPLREHKIVKTINPFLPGIHVTPPVTSYLFTIISFCTV